MIKVENLSFSYPQKDLLENISFTIEDNEHCALIGSSGNGKSTLCQLLLHPEKYTYEGLLRLPKNCRMGYVSQFTHPVESKEISVFDYIASDFVALEKEILDICHKLETAVDDTSRLLDQYQEKLTLFQLMDGDSYESNIDKKLKSAGLSGHRNQPLSILSGGEFKLVSIIKEMLLVPQLMIMDEPDGFLDFQNLSALALLINQYQGSLLVITHNRYLLSQCFQKILHLENKDLQEFSGTYLEYSFTLLAQKTDHMEQSLADAKEIDRNEALVDRLREVTTTNADGSRGRALRARVSLLARLKERQVKEPFLQLEKPPIHFPSLSDEDLLNQDCLLEVKQYSKAFQNTLFTEASFSLKAGEKIALIGPNGTGKTTLLRDIYENNHPAIHFSDAARPAFLAQVPEDSSDLSGGEKTLLQLTRLGDTHANLLLLDEPTSHLDTLGQLAFEEAVRNYKGAILMVSHDFYTIANCMDSCLLIEDCQLRTLRIRKFRQMIYQNHFDKSYLEFEQKKVQLDLFIQQAIKDEQFDKARALLAQLEELISQLPS